MHNLEIERALRGKRVLVTGHTGFKGSWLCLWLTQLGAKVAGFALDPLYEKNHFDLLELGQDILDTRGDVCDAAALQEVFRRFEPEIVFHLAAQPLVGRSYVEPKLTFDTNFGGGVNLLETVRETSSVQALIFVTSDKCYRNKEWIWGYRESDQLGGYDPYSASKAAIELAFSSYLETYFYQRPHFGAATVRAGNVIGGGDWSADRLIPDCIKALEAGEPISLRNPSSTRPWQYVLEPISGYLLLAARLLAEPVQYSGAWNFGPDSRSSHSVQEAADEIVRLWGSGTVQTTIRETAPKEAGLLHLNCDKAHLELGWHARWGFHRAVAELVEWYRGFFAGEPVKEITSRQIERYCNGGPTLTKDRSRDGETTAGAVTKELTT